MRLLTGFTAQSARLWRGSNINLRLPVSGVAEEGDLGGVDDGVRGQWRFYDDVRAVLRMRWLLEKRPSIQASKAINIQYPRLCRE